MESRMNIKWVAMNCAWVLAVFPSSGFAASTRAGAVTGSIHLQIMQPDIFSDTADAKEDIRQAILKAANEKKRVLLDFGANWCPDCKVLNIYFHDPGNAALLAANYILVEVDVGQYNKNLDLARKYGIPLDKGIPALAVLDGSGKVVYAQRGGEFQAMRKLDSEAITAFLLKWKPSSGAGPHPTRR